MKAKELLTPKSKLTTLFSDMNIKQALEIILKSGLTGVPVLERESKRYLYSVSTSALLKKVVEAQDLAKTYEEPLASVPLERMSLAASVDANVQNLIDLIVNQNFVPIVDNTGVFQGIVTRKAVINYLCDLAEL
ncbi:MAG: CBS domain-containing protein [Bacilli bacterium]|nr:CBS domain-containing protein [Bacilli bacterium]